MVPALLHFAALPSLTFQCDFEGVTGACDDRQTEVDKRHVPENTVSSNPTLAA